MGMFYGYRIYGLWQDRENSLKGYRVVPQATDAEAGTGTTRQGGDPGCLETVVASVHVWYSRRRERKANANLQEQNEPIPAENATVAIEE